MKRDYETDSFEDPEREPGAPSEGVARRVAWADAPLTGDASRACRGEMSLDEAIAAEARADRVERRRARSRTSLPLLPPALEVDDASDPAIPFQPRLSSRSIRGLLAIPATGGRQGCDTRPKPSRMSRILRAFLGPVERDGTS